jgi:glycosyltransferase involved in cell wall biosynthesis
MRVAYLVSRYPAPSHAFLLREVGGLRAAGVEVETISIRRPGAEELLSDSDRAEAARTFFVLPAGPMALLAAHLGELARGPRRYLLTIARALRLAGPGWRAHLWALFYFAEAIVVRRHCRRLGIDHLHGVQFADGAGDVALLAAHRAGSRGRGWTLSLAVHGPTELYEVRRYGLAEKVRGAGLVVVPSEFTRSQLLAQVEERHRQRIAVVHMGADLERFTPRPDSGRVGSEARILCVARLVRHKGQATLLRALDALASDGLFPHTVLVGEGPERVALERLRGELGLEGRVEMTGAVGQDDLPRLYREADVFCLPTLAETVGVVNMEAMASGVPVVTSNLMGVPELVEDGVSGLLVTPAREDELAAALRRLAGDPDERRRIGEEGRRKVEAEFDSRAQAARLSRLFEDLRLDHRGP